MSSHLVLTYQVHYNITVFLFKKIILVFNLKLSNSLRLDNLNLSDRSCLNIISTKALFNIVDLKINDLAVAITIRTQF